MIDGFMDTFRRHTGLQKHLRSIYLQYKRTSYTCVIRFQWNVCTLFLHSVNHHRHSHFKRSITPQGYHFHYKCKFCSYTFSTWFSSNKLFFSFYICLIQNELEKNCFSFEMIYSLTVIDTITSPLIIDWRYRQILGICYVYVCSEV